MRKSDAASKAKDAQGRSYFSGLWRRETVPFHQRSDPIRRRAMRLQRLTKLRVRDIFRDLGEGEPIRFDPIQSDSTKSECSNPDSTKSEISFTDAHTQNSCWSPSGAPDP